MADDSQDSPSKSRPESFADEEKTVAVKMSPELLALAEGSRPPVREELQKVPEEDSPVAEEQVPVRDKTLTTPDTPEAKEKLSEAAPGPALAKRLGPAFFGLLEVSLFALVATVVFVFRFLQLEEIEVGGDALRVWEFARSLAHGGGLPEKFDHHTSRFGLVLPTLLVQKFFGSQATTYFIGPLVASVWLHAFVYLIGRLLSGPVAGVLAVLVLLQLGPMVRASSQILPETFGPAYVATAYYLAFLHTQARRPFWRNASLALAGAALFFAYGAKESYLYFAPGLAFVVWFGAEPGERPSPRVETPEENSSRLSRVVFWAKERRLLLPLALTLVVVGLILLETLVLSATTGTSGRLSVVNSSHGVISDERLRIHQFSDFFLLFSRAPHEWTPVLVGGGLATIGLLGFGRDRRSRLFSLSLITFAALQTFVVRRLDPLIPWMEPHPRYLLAMAAPLALIIGLFVTDAVAQILSRMSRGEVSARRRFADRTLVLLFSCALLLQTGNELRQRAEQEWGKQGAWVRAQKTADDLTEAFRAGHPIVSESLEGKPAWAAAALFIHPEVLKSEGVLLSHRKILRKRGRGKYVARVLPGLRGGKKRQVDALVNARVRGRKCAVVLTQSSRFMRGKMTVPKSCRSLEDELKRR